MVFRPRRFQPTEDLIILRGRQQGVGWKTLAKTLNRGHETIRERHDKLTGGEKRANDSRLNARQPKFTNSLPMLGAVQERIDDSPHVRAVTLEGGFRSRKRNDSGPVFAATSRGLVCVGTWEGGVR